ncbi:MAG: M28 family peptidase [Bacteroidota bacterium]
MTFISRLLLFTIVCMAMLVTSCGQKNAGQEKQEKQAQRYRQISPAFDVDSCYSFLKKQVDFGPRVPGTKAHAACADYLVSQLRKYGFTCVVQEAPVKTYDGKTFRLKNIIASTAPQNPDRMLLMSHWDCRPIADGETENRNKPIDGADDAASGVAVWLEVARQIHASGMKKGIDIFFTDLEDYGQPSGEGSNMPDTWCLGTQYWSKNPHVPAYKARLGILLDMVGAKGAIFPREGTSVKYAAPYVDAIWQTAYDLGYAGIFVDAETGETTDDHLYINKIAGIPCVDIVHMDPNTGTYGRHHHTHGDNLGIIDKNTLKVVGQTVMEYIWKQ